MIRITIKGSGGLGVKDLHDTTNRSGHRQRKGSLSGSYCARLHLLLSDDLEIKWKNTGHFKCRVDSGLSKGFLKCLPEYLHKISLPHISCMSLLELRDGFLPCLLHTCKANDIQTLQRMSAVGRVPKDDNLVV